MSEIRKQSVREKVLQILKEYPETRGDDKALLTFYWYLHDGVKFDGIQEFALTFKNATPEGSITRARRYIQYSPQYTGERYLPDIDEEHLSIMRKIRAKEVIENYR